MRYRYYTGAGAGRPRVLKVSFLANGEASKMTYTNAGSKIDPPTVEAGTEYAFYEWRVGSIDGEKYEKTVEERFAEIAIDEVNIVAVRQEKYAGEDFTVSATYSPGIQTLTVDLDAHMSYEANTSTVGKFDYELTSKAAIPAAELSDDGSTLTISAGLSVRNGGYTLTVTAS